MAEASPDTAGKSEWSEVFIRHHQFLLDHMDPDFGLLEHLVTSEILSFEQRHIVKAELTTNQRNRKVLDIIRTEDKWDGLIDALKSSKQTHIVKYLEVDGKNSSDVDWPLGEREEKILRTNYMNLIDLIEAPELVGLLYSAEVINKSQRDFIGEKKISSDKNAALIDILLRRSIGDYNKTIYFLKATNQPHIARLLKEGGALVKLHVNTDAASEREIQIAEEIKRKLANSSEEEKRRILELVQLDIYGAEHGQSIVLYVYLQTRIELDHLKMSLQARLTRDNIQLFFNTIASASEKVTILRVTVAENELSRLENYLRAAVILRVKTDETTDEEMEISEELARILGSKSVEKRVRIMEHLRRNIIAAQSGQSDTGSLSAGHRLPKSVLDAGQRRHATDTDISVETLVRHKSFLIETIEPDFGLLDELLRFRTLALKDVTIIKSNSPYNKRNAKLLDYIIERSECEDLVASLRNTRQGHIVNYLAADGEYRSEFGSDWPLTKKQITILDTNQRVLLQLINMTIILDLLFSKDVVNKRQRDEISSKESYPERNKVFLEFLSRRSQRDYINTILCLKRSNQAYIAQILNEVGETDKTTDEEMEISEELARSLGSKSEERRQRIMDLPMNIIIAKPGKTDKASFSGRYGGKSAVKHGRDATDTDISTETLSRHEPFLEEIIDPDFGLLDELIRSGTLTYIDAEEISCQSSFYQRNAILLDYIIKQSKFESFVASLRNTRQGHVANYLVADGEYRDAFGSEWPLTEDQVEILVENHGTLVDLIDETELLYLLLSKGVINKRQFDYVDSKAAPHTKNDALLEILRRMSQTDYRNTIECLRESYQPHVAKILEKGGVTVRVHVGTDETTDEEEMRLTEKLNMILGDRSAEERRRILDLTQRNFVAAKPGQ